MQETERSKKITHPMTPPIDGPFLLTHKPRPLRTSSRTFFSYSGLRSRHIFAASTFAGLSSFGSASILITEMRIFSTL